MGKRLKQIFTFKSLLILLTSIGLLSLLFAYMAPFIHPNTMSFLPFFGLSYWIIILSNIVFLVIWGIKKSKWALFILLLILIGGKLHFRTLSFGSDDENENNRTELNVMSYNVRLFGLYSTINAVNQNTKNKIFEYLAKEQPDVVCFQEFYQQDKPTSFVTKDSLKKILNSVDYHERYSTKMYGRQNFGIALFSKYPIIEKGNVIFSGERKSFNYCIYADIVKNQDTFRIYNVHLQSIRLQQDDYAIFNDEEKTVAEQPSNVFKLMNKIAQAYPIRADQAIQIAKHIKASPFPVIVCGDFNDSPLSYSYNQFSRLLTDAFKNTSIGFGATYAGNIPAGRIDYIFHSPECGSKEFKIQSEKLSDHYAIQCKIFIKEE